MWYIANDKEERINYCGRKYQSEMESRGWRIVIPEVVLDEGARYSRRETAQEMYDRLIQTGKR